MLLKYVPNALTISRFLLIPFIILPAIQGDYIVSILFLTLSGITDILDGTIARKYNLISDFGKLIDPVADKATQLSILATLVIQNVIPLWILLVVLVKEFIMISGASFLYGKELIVSSKWYGKLSTVLFYVAIVFTLAIRALKAFDLPRFVLYIDRPIYYLAILSTIFSLLMYIKAFYMQGYLKDMQKNSSKTNGSKRENG